MSIQQLIEKYSRWAKVATQMANAIDPTPGQFDGEKHRRLTTKAFLCNKMAEDLRLLLPVELNLCDEKDLTLN